MKSTVDYCTKCGSPKWKTSGFDASQNGSTTCNACHNKIKICNGEVCIEEKLLLRRIYKAMQSALEDGNFHQLSEEVKGAKKAMITQTLFLTFCEKLANKNTMPAEYREFLDLRHDKAPALEYENILSWVFKFFDTSEREYIRGFISRSSLVEGAKDKRCEELDIKMAEAEKQEELLKAARPTKNEPRGNSPGNIINGGYVWESSSKKGLDLEYFCHGDDFCKLYGRRNGETKRLSASPSRFINVVGDWVYFVNVEDSYVYKTTFDKEEPDCLCDEIKVDYVTVVGQWVYCSDESAGGQLCRISIDDGRLEYLDEDSDHKCEYINVDGEWVYYRSATDDGKIYKVHRDGKRGRQLVCEDNCINIIVDGKWVYYINISDGCAMYKILKERKDRNTDKGIKLCSVPCRTINVAGKWIYYTSDLDKCNLYKISRNVKQRSADSIHNSNSLVCTDKCWFINVAGDYIYYRNMSNGGKLCKVNRDTKSGKQL